MNKCKFSPEEPCYPLACLTRSISANSALELHTHLPLDEGAVDLEKVDTLHTIIMNTMNCALDKVSEVEEASALFKG